MQSATSTINVKSQVQRISDSVQIQGQQLPVYVAGSRRIQDPAFYQIHCVQTIALLAYLETNETGLVALERALRLSTTGPNVVPAKVPVFGIPEDMI